MTYKGVGSSVERLENVQYYDGLGRPVQQVLKNQSAELNNIVTHTEYDSNGMQVKEYLPFKSSGNTLDFVENAASALSSHYSTVNDPPTNFPYSEKVYEKSPRQRLLEQSAPGETWQLANQHTIKFGYETNGESQVVKLAAKTTINTSYLLYEPTKIQQALIPTTHAKYFDSELLFDELQTATLENKSLKRLIDCLADNDTLPATFWNLNWSFFFTVAYRAERNKKSCFRLMTAMFEELDTKYGDSTYLRIFFATEPFTSSKGYHNHFVI